MRRSLLALGFAAALLAGCGEDEPTYEGSYEPVDPTSNATAPSATAPSATAEPEPVDCTTDAVARFPGAGEISLQDGKAVALGGPAYTIFAGDLDIPADGLAFSGYEAGPGEHVAFVATTVYNGTAESAELEVGVPITWTDEFEVLTFAIVLDEEGEQLGNNIGATGTLTVTGLSDTEICVDVDYRDDEKSVVGTIAAQIV